MKAIKKEINGIVLLNKERGISSNKAVNKVKYLLNASKAGHLGTLDVLGEGLLPVVLGKGTKLFEYYLNKDKVYKTTFKFGETTDTLDLEGEITNSNDVTVSLEMLQETVKDFVGKQMQMPPQYSAKKVSGRKAYELARAGQEVTLKPKEIEIYAINVIKEVGTNTFELEVACSSGTYIRSLCRDIASRLSTYGVMLNIQRTKCGDFYLADAKSIEQIENGDFEVISLDTLFDFPSVILAEDEEKRLLNGVPVKTQAPINAEMVKVYGKQFLGIAKNTEKGLKFEIRLI